MGMVVGFRILENTFRQNTRSTVRVGRMVMERLEPRQP
jgi:hypothetical protein